MNWTVDCRLIMILSFITAHLLLCSVSVDDWRKKKSLR